MCDNGRMNVALQAKSWPFEQARTLLRALVTKRLRGPDIKLANSMLMQGEVASVVKLLGNDPVVFETGYGPSGAPHIGTFAEVVRTQMVRTAFIELTGGKMPTELIAFSDDYDGFRRVPDDYEGQGLEIYLGRPLSGVPDPQDEFPSFASRNNAALREYIARHLGLVEGEGQDYEFVSSTQQYKTGRFDQMLLRVWKNYDAIMRVMLSTLREDRRATYSPFLPVHDGVVLQVPTTLGERPGEISYEHEGQTYTINIFTGNVKLQWKVDWAMRWAELGVDYEMHGKDLIESERLAKKICIILGQTPPVTYFYELFLDENGEKISKSKGNGFTVEQWLEYSTPDPLAFYMFQSPRSAKILGPSVVPRSNDDYLKALREFYDKPKDAQYDSPIWHVHKGKVPTFGSDVSFGMLLNLVSLTPDPDVETVETYLRQYRSVTLDQSLVKTFIPGAIAYNRDHIEKGARRAPTYEEQFTFNILADKLEEATDHTAEGYQTICFAVGKLFPEQYKSLRDWFRTLYEVFFGSDSGPRFGAFISAYGLEASIKLLRGK